MAKASCKIDREIRVQRVLDLIALGYKVYQVIDICSKEWGIGRRQIERYLTIVYSFLREQSKIDREQAVAEYDSLINRSELSGDKELARKYRLQRDKIAQLVVDKVEHSGTISIPEVIRIDTQRRAPSNDSEE